MYLRRYYKKGMKYKYTVTEAYLFELIDTLGESEASKIDNASYEIILESPEEEKAWFFECLERVRRSTRWYLENLDAIPTFKVNMSKIFPKMRK